MDLIFSKLKQSKIQINDDTPKPSTEPSEHIVIDDFEPEKPVEILPDPIPILEIKPDIEVKVDERKGTIIRIKAIAFDRMGKHPLTDVSDLSEREKKRFMSFIDELIKKAEVDPESIIQEFNEICSDTIFHPKNVDYSSLPVYNF